MERQDRDASRQRVPGEETAGGPDQDEIRSVTQLLQLVDKTVKTLTLYPVSNPIAQRFLKELTGRFLGHLQEYGLLKLQVQQYALLYSGQAVYENTDRQESLALKLFLDGIAELVFHEGLEAEELARLLEILIRNYDPDTADDDLVTLLWDASFAHIAFTVAEDTGESPELPTSSLARVQPNLRKVLEEETEDDSSAVELSHPKFGAREGLEVFQLTPEELERLEAEIASEQKPHATRRLIDMLAAILHVETDADAFRETAEIMDQLLAHLTLTGDWAHSALILETFRGLPQEGDLAEAYRRCLAEVTDRAGSPERIKAIEAVLKTSGERAGAHLLSFLLLLNRNALLPLCELLGRLESTGLRTLVSDALVQLGTNSSEILASKLTDERWPLVRDLVSVLGRIGDPRVIDRFHPLVSHPRVAVRKAVLRALEQLDHPKAKDLFVSFLNDFVSFLNDFVNDQDQEIRVAAVKALAQTYYQPAREPLLEIIQSRACKEKSLYEKKALFDALGTIGGDEVIPTLEEILTKRCWLFLRDPKQDEMRVCAVSALKQIGTSEAIAVLEEGRTRWNKVIRDACAEALAELRGEVGIGTPRS